MFGLSFLSPAFLAAAAGAAVPIALHLLHRRVEPIVSFPAMRFLRRAPVEQVRRRRVRELLLLALRVAACVLLAVAFARPFVSSAGAVAGPVTVVAVDTSFSLTAPGQFERAKQLARDAVRSAPVDHEVAVVSFSDRADVIAPPSRDRALTIAAVDGLSAGFGATRYRAALVRAAGLIGARRGRIVVVTDLQQAGWDAHVDGGVPSPVAVDLRDVGAPAGNVAVVALRRDDAGVIAVVRNFGTASRSDTVRFALGRRTIRSVPIVVSADASVEARADIPLPTSGVLSATVTDPVGYAADNVRYLALDAEATTRVLLVTTSGTLDPDAFYLERAMQAADGVRFALSATAGARFSALEPTALQHYGAIALLGTRGVDHRGRTLLVDYVRSGGGLLIAAGADVEPSVVTGALGPLVSLRDWQGTTDASLSLAPVDSRHPIFVGFARVPGSLSRVRFERVARIDPGRDGHPLARYDNGLPALVEWNAGRGRVLLFASDLNNRGNDFPIQPAFVPFVHELMRYLAARPSSAARELLVADVPAGAPPRPGPVLRPVGTRGSETAATLVANVDVRESDPARTGHDGFLAAITRLRAEAVDQQRADRQAREQDQRLWAGALALVLAALIGESALGRRMA